MGASLVAPYACADMSTHGQARPEPDDAKRRELQRRSNRPRGGTTDGHHRTSTTSTQPSEQQIPEDRRGRRRPQGKPRDPAEPGGQKSRRERLSPDEREARSARRRDARLGKNLEITYPADLPVSQRKDDLAAAIRDHQVVIVAGETGSGKTTQLPKICLELGRGVDGADRSHPAPADRGPHRRRPHRRGDSGTELGDVVGFKVRFNDQVSDGTRVKVMTDGILLAELANDRLLRQYDTIIIDEAHERSLNIDFILGVLRELLPKRPDLKLIITSATIDPERFSRHFGDAPIIEVSGRTYPVEVRYRPLLPDTDDDEDAEPRDQVQAICDAVDELIAEGPGDILVFCSGEREIRDTADAIAGMKLFETEVLPLYARLSHRRAAPGLRQAHRAPDRAGHQRRRDQPHRARHQVRHRPGHRAHLPLQPAAQGAAAADRADLAGQRQPAHRPMRPDQRRHLHPALLRGRLRRSRPEFTDAEILRTNLAGVILQMTAYRLGDMATFPFIDPPDKRNIADGVALLQELGAFRRSDSGS